MYTAILSVFSVILQDFYNMVVLTTVHLSITLKPIPKKIMSPVCLMLSVQLKKLSNHANLKKKKKISVDALSPDWKHERMFRREEAARRAAEEESARRAAEEEEEINSLIAMYTKMSLKGGKTRVKKGRTRKHIKCNTRRKRRNKHKTLVRKHFK